nr:hypothetical protein [Kofleriaceae bacterium]
MRAALVAIAVTAVTGCYAALPMPAAPAIHGTVTLSGGTLGSWRLSLTKATPADGDLDAIDLVDPTARPVTIRVVRLPATTLPGDVTTTPRGSYTERAAPRDVEIHIASGDTEVTLTPERCTRLDAIMRASQGVAFASARFDCDLGAAGRVTGDLEANAGGSMQHVSSFAGHLEASDGSLAHTRFAPDSGETDNRGVFVWDHRYPRVVFELVEQATDTSIRGAESNALLRVHSTASSVASFDVAPDGCRVLRLDRASTGYVRIGTRQHTSWAGTATLDCDAPGGGRIVGELTLSN